MWHRICFATVKRYLFRVTDCLDARLLSTKKEGFYEVESFFCWQSRNLQSLPMTFFCEIANVHQALCHVGSVPLDSPVFPAGGTSEE